MIFSVIIPTLNEEKYIPRLLSSLEKQNFSDFEVIVVDGKSTDKTVSRVKDFSRRIKNLNIVFSAKPNVSIQRNLGAKQATGQYLVFFDADVAVPRNYFQSIKKLIDKKKALLITTWIKPDSTTSQDMIMIAIGNVGMEVANRLDRPFVGGQNIIVNKHLFHIVGGFNPKLFQSEDHDFAARCLDAGVKLTILRKPRQTISLRRFRKYGYLAILRKYAKSSVYRLLQKPITTAIYEYPMGGAIYENGEKLNRAKFEEKLWNAIKSVLNKPIL